MSDTTVVPEIQTILAGDEFGLAQMQEIGVAVSASKQAVSSLQEALASLDSDSAPGGDTITAVSLRKGYLLLVLGRHEEAAEVLRSVAGNQLGTLLLGRCLVELGARAEAVEVLAEGLKAHNRSAPLAVALTEAQLLNGDFSAAGKRLASLANKGVSAADVAFLEGLLCEVQGDYAEGVAGYEKAISEQPDHAKALFRLGYHHATYGDEEKALSYYVRCEELTPNHGNALLNLGILYEDRGEYDKASDAYERVLRVIPNHSRARMFLKDARSSMHMFYDEDTERRTDRRNQILKIPVTDFELSVRSRNCLNKMNIKCLGDLVQKTETELLSYKNFGETSLQEIKQMLSQKGLRLGMGRPDQPGFFDAVGAGSDEEDGSAEIGEDVLNKPLGELNLSVRSGKVMEKLGIETVGELCRRGEAELLSAKNFGQTSLAEIRLKLGELGVTLSSGPAPAPAPAPVLGPDSGPAPAPGLGPDSGPAPVSESSIL